MSWTLSRTLSWTLSWILSWIPRYVPASYLGCALPERGSLRAVCRSQSSENCSLHCSWPCSFNQLWVRSSYPQWVRSSYPQWVRSSGIHHVVLDLRLLRLVVNWLSDSLSPGSSNLAVFTQTAGFSLSCVRSRRRCSRVRQSHVLAHVFVSSHAHSHATRGLGVPGPTVSTFRALRVKRLFLPELGCSGSSLQFSAMVVNSAVPRV